MDPQLFATIDDVRSHPFTGFLLSSCYPFQVGTHLAKIRNCLRFPVPDLPFESHLSASLFRRNFLRRSWALTLERYSPIWATARSSRRCVTRSCHRAASRTSGGRREPLAAIGAHHQLVVVVGLLAHRHEIPEFDLDQKMSAWPVPSKIDPDQASAGPLLLVV